MSVVEAIREAETHLPGVPVDDGQDPRWQAIIAVGEFVESEPEAVWVFVRRWAGHAQEDLRMAVATCFLEHLLEYHFAAYFPRVEELAAADPLFGDTFGGCAPFGQSSEPGNVERFQALRKKLGRLA